jgi:hypothetical protein
VITTVPFQYLTHLLTVPVRVGGVDATFIFDTGIGPNLVSGSLAARVGCAPDGQVFTGRRMSGQAVSIPLGTLSSVELGECRQDGVQAGVFDLNVGQQQIDGFLSLSYFRNLPVTVDYPAGVLVVEDAQSVARRAEAGTCVPVRADYDGCSTDLLLGLTLPGGRAITVEVDTGSDILILNEPLAADAGIDLDGVGVRTTRLSDETGHEVTRRFGTLPGPVCVTGAPRLCQSDPEVMFQQIIYDGLAGDRFLRNFVVTYDLPAARMIFAVPG